jgi:hypothetical protein
VVEECTSVAGAIQRRSRQLYGSIGRGHVSLLVHRVVPRCDGLSLLLLTGVPL